MTIEGQKIPCKLQQLESVVSNGRTVTKILLLDNRCALYAQARERHL